MAPGVQSGYHVCTDARDEYCVGRNNTTDCFICFAGANVVVIRHPEGSVAFATRYDHLRNGSIVVEPGRPCAAATRSPRGQRGQLHRAAPALRGLGRRLLRARRSLGGPLRSNRGPSLWDPSLGL
jgi:hypothetical protein